MSIATIVAAAMLVGAASCSAASKDYLLQHSLVFGGAEYDVGSPWITRTNHVDLAQVIGYRLVINRGLGFSFAWSRFMVRMRGDYATDDRVKCFEFGPLWSLDWRTGRSSLALVPSLGIMLESSWTDDLVNNVSTPECWGCGDGRSDSRRYIAPGIAAEFSYGPVWRNMSVGLGGSAQRLIDWSVKVYDARQAPKLRARYGVHLVITMDFQMAIRQDDG